MNKNLIFDYAREADLKSLATATVEEVVESLVMMGSDTTQALETDGYTLVEAAIELIKEAKESIS